MNFVNNLDMIEVVMTPKKPLIREASIDKSDLDLICHNLVDHMRDFKTARRA